MSISDTKAAQKYASIAEVAAAQAKEVLTEALLAPEYANQAAASAAEAASAAQQAQDAADNAATNATSIINDQLQEQKTEFDTDQAERDAQYSETLKKITVLGAPYKDLPTAQSDIAAGDIPDGAYFFVVSDNEFSLADEYVNLSGVATATGKKQASEEFVKEAYDTAQQASESVPVEDVLPDLVPVVQDSVGNVPIWLEDGDINAKGVTPSFADKSAEASQIISAISQKVPSESVAPQLVPVVQDADGKVAIWLSNGDLAARGVSGEMSDKVASSGTILPSVVGMLPSETVSPQMVPVVQDDAGNVPIWLEDGNIGGKGLASSLLDAIAASISSRFQAPLKYTDGRSCWKWRASKSKYKLSLTSKLKVGFTGDSWTEKRAIPQMLANILYTEYANVGGEWINFGSANGDTLNGMTFNISGWTTYDASETTTAPTYGCALDGLCIYASGTTARVTLNSLKTTNMSLYYRDTSGTFRYTIDDGNPVSVTGTGSNNTVKLDIAGLSASSLHKLVIDLTGNTDTVVIYGVYSTVSGNGVEIQKFGNANITADGYAKVLPYISYFAKQLDPDVVFMIIGTNDYRLGRTLTNFYTYLSSWVEAYKTAIPDTALVLVAPPQCNATGSYPMSSYRDVMRAVAREKSVEFFSLYDDFPSSYATANSYGLWNDALHLNTTGADFLSREINKYFL